MGPAAVKLIDYPILIIVWGQDGCPACSEYVPRFRRVANRYQRCLPSVVVDAEKFERAANHYRIRETPTTMISRYGRRSLYSISGAAGEGEIDKLFQYAMTGMDCKL
jgi:thioredoxin-like negative regulator of GroEL